VFALILDKFYDDMEDSLNVDSFDKSLLVSISFTMEGSVLSNRLLICLSKYSLLNFRS